MKQFNIPHQYQSGFISQLKNIRQEADKLKKDLVPTILEFENVEIALARHFGFCFGVQNAVEKAYQILKKYPEKDIYLLSEIIHNPHVNTDLQKKGMRFIMDTYGNVKIPFDNLKKEDIVIIPAFGTTPELEQKLNEKGIQIEEYDTTCPFVERVWNKGEKLAKDGYTIIVHGKPTHEETRATFKRIERYGPAMIIYNLEEAKLLGLLIKQEIQKEEFEVKVKPIKSAGFNYTKDLQKIAVVNQTTMLAEETQQISDYLREEMVMKYGVEQVDKHFGSTRDTLCYATNENQSATITMAQTKPDIAFVIGGYNSSNTTKLVKILNNFCPTYFIEDADKLLNEKEIKHFNIETSKEVVDSIDLGKKNIRIGITTGASCPDVLVEELIQKILLFKKQNQLLDSAVNKVAAKYNGL
ncbi:4-hydroxy-3-methylbut-2-enyl diphosphate reductase [Paracrocinitomix mangrovi]|uniref:4-hydroxy-3-methylbut-2-enyl diphosphate reductase n=1 Tax=Paracrocinitomix mangrovi TaxID=2862509 RepID=UPI001C8E61CE|nr:4-hydroxy-3-methylbut-2-enyl diphosphate reductase [Paracrocinitomix mangrovi]UKN01866.1 4-hydroxy-3-methylbut-2-enyl diphosphate reductase [Paracrocinitomix mangrovi]